MAIRQACEEGKVLPKSKDNDDLYVHIHVSLAVQRSSPVSHSRESQVGVRWISRSMANWLTLFHQSLYHCCVLLSSVGFFSTLVAWKNLRYLVAMAIRSVLLLCCLSEPQDVYLSSKNLEIVQKPQVIPCMVNMKGQLEMIDLWAWKTWGGRLTIMKGRGGIPYVISSGWIMLITQCMYIYCHIYIYI